MTTKLMSELKKYTPVAHTRYGSCITLDHIIDFGPVILPITVKGLERLTNDSGMPPGTPYLCSDYKQNLKLISEYESNKIN